MLHERDAFPLDRVRDESLRRVATGPEAGEDGPQRGMVVAVAGLDLPPERPQLRLEVSEPEDFLCRLVGLQLVAVDDDPEPAEAVMRRRLERLPVLALLQLAVAGHHDCEAAATSPPLRPGDPPSLRDAHAQRSRVRLDAGHAHVRMAVEPAEPAQPREPLRRDDAEPVQRGVQPGHVVALRREEHVAIGTVETDVGDVQLRVQEVHDDVEGAEARPEVPRACALDGDECVQPADVGDQRQRRIGVTVRRENAVDALPVDKRERRHGERR